MSKPQRRKGNAKTASSAQAADLLGSTGFIGFDIGVANVFESVDSEFTDLENEVTLILKKLSKKDPQTREKALRELYDYISSKAAEEVEGTFVYYATAFPKLSLDGSPIVRQLSLKCLALFISKLKKTAEKHLKKLVPFILIGSTDISTVVCAQAEELLRSCFPDGKSEKVIQLFAEETANVCCEFISQTHPLSAPQKYDDEEIATQRENRLTTASLNLLSKLSERHPAAAEIALGLFKNSGQLKKFLSSSTPQVQSGLLNLAQRLPSSFNLTDSPIAQYAVNHLDNADVAIGTSCFNLLHLLITKYKETFFTKFDVKKTLVPRLLTIVRKKIGHWKYCGPFLLPSFAAIYNQIAVEDAQAFSLSFLASFSDNMPFTIASVGLSSWSSAFCECVKFYLTRVADSPASVTEQLVPILVSTVDKADLSFEDVQDDFVGLIGWICDKKCLPPTQLSSLVNNLELNLINKRPQTDSIITKLFSLGLQELITFHSDALRKTDVPICFITSLAESRDEYFTTITSKADTFKLLSSEEWILSRNELEKLAIVSLRLLKFNDQKRTLREDLSLAILTKRNSCHACEIDLDTLLDRLNLDVKDPAVFLTLMKASDLNKDDGLFVDILKSCKISAQEEIMQNILDSCDFHEIGLVLKALQSINWNISMKKNISTWIWLQYFNPKNSQFDSLAEILMKYQPDPETIEEFFPFCFSNKLTRYPAGTLTFYLEPSADRLLRLCDTIPAIYKALAVTPIYLQFLINAADHHFAIRELANRSPFLSSFSSESAALLEVSDEEGLAFVNRLAPSIPLYIALLQTGKFKDVQSHTLALLQIFDSFVDLVRGTEYLECGYESIVQTIRQFFNEDVTRVFEAVNALTDVTLLHSSIVHKALNSISLHYPSDSYNTPQDIPLSVCWAMRKNCTHIKMGIAERFLTRFYCEDTPIDFISQLQLYCSQDGSTWQEDNRLFSANAKDPLIWQLNVAILQASASVISESFKSLTPSQLDFIMCGLVVVFETSDDIYNNDEPRTIQTEALLGNALLLFKVCCQAHQTHGDLVFSDWKDFYYPFVTRILVRMWNKLSLSATSPATLAVREMCRAVYNLKEIPIDLDLCVDSLEDDYKYDEQTRALNNRSLKGLRSNNYLDEFSSLHVLLLLSPSMFRQENGDWVDEDSVVATGPKKLVVPAPFRDSIENKAHRGFLRFACMKAALEPLKSDQLVDEEKLIYCECFPSLINIVLPELIEAYRSQSIQVSNPFMKQMAGTPSDYLLSIIKEMCSCIPAVVRPWYNGLPKAAAVIVNKFIVENVSHEIITNELNRVKEENKQLKKNNAFRIRVIPVSRQIVAEYTIEETKMVLTISMPENYPLGVPEIDLEKGVVPTARSKKWLLQLTSYLFYQNGSIVNGILKWKQNVDKDVEGAEACCICMTTINFDTHQLPKVQCKQCRNKFHSACIYKWFHTSHSMACPLCRTNFN